MRHGGEPREGKGQRRRSTDRAGRTKRGVGVSERVLSEHSARPSQPPSSSGPRRDERTKAGASGILASELEPVNEQASFRVGPCATRSGSLPRSCRRAPASVDRRGVYEGEERGGECVSEKHRQALPNRRMCCTRLARGREPPPSVSPDGQADIRIRTERDGGVGAKRTLDLGVGHGRVVLRGQI
jgi:hypothetical protein